MVNSCLVHSRALPSAVCWFAYRFGQRQTFQMWHMSAKEEHSLFRIILVDFTFHQYGRATHDALTFDELYQRNEHSEFPVAFWSKWRQRFNNICNLFCLPLSDVLQYDDIFLSSLQVNTIFRQMEEKFSAASEQVMHRMDELGKRIDTLETSLGDIITQLPSEPSTSTSRTVKATKSWSDSCTRFTHSTSIRTIVCNLSK